MHREYPLLTRDMIFVKNEPVYINRSDELRKFCGIMHTHDFIEIAYVIKGSGIHVIDGITHDTAKGDLFVIYSGMAHGFFREKKELQEPVVYNCAFLPEFLKPSVFLTREIKSASIGNGSSPELSLKGTEFREIGNLFSRMYSEYGTKQSGYCDVIRAHLIELVVRVFRHMDKNTDECAPVAKNRELVNRAVEYVRKNYNSEIRLEDLAADSYISRSYLSRLFRETTGLSFSDYVQQLRVDEACTLLEKTDMKVVDIAHNSGFNDIKFFYRVFRKITGTTPGGYRKKRI